MEMPPENERNSKDFDFRNKKAADKLLFGRHI